MKERKEIAVGSNSSRGSALSFLLGQLPPPLPYVMEVGAYMV